MTTKRIDLNNDFEFPTLYVESLYRTVFLCPHGPVRDVCLTLDILFCFMNDMLNILIFIQILVVFM